MRKLILLLTIIAIPFLCEARHLWAFLTYSTFNSPEGPYVETYMTVAGNSVQYIKKDNGKYQATVNVLMAFKQNNVVSAFNKYELNSPEIDDTTKNTYEFLDEQRFLLPNGTYDFEVKLEDKNNPGKANPFTQSVLIDYPDGKPAVSGIQLVSKFSKSTEEKPITKSGFDLVPNVYSYYPQSDTRLRFYCEIYNMDKIMAPGSKYIVKYYLQSYENLMSLNNFTRIKAQTAKPVDVILAEFDIGNLATGMYYIVVEARDQNNKVVTSGKMFIQRNNPDARVSYEDIFALSAKSTFAERITNMDTLREYISSTYPICSGLERSYLRGFMKTANKETLQDYFYGFWKRRDEANPERAWLLYKQQVIIAQNTFGTRIKKGYQSDRGRVFLEYGPPNTRSTQYMEPATYPYEIWQYYTLKGNQRNKKFVFYSHDMVTSDFTLLHSDAIGEVTNPNWQSEIYSRVITPPHDLGDQHVVESWGGMSQDYWDLPN